MSCSSEVLISFNSHSSWLCSVQHELSKGEILLFFLWVVDYMLGLPTMSPSSVPAPDHLATAILFRGGQHAAPRTAGARNEITKTNKTIRSLLLVLQQVIFFFMQNGLPVPWGTSSWCLVKVWEKFLWWKTLHLCYTEEKTNCCHPHYVTC